jgi:hypothetical protein
MPALMVFRDHSIEGSNAPRSPRYLETNCKVPRHAHKAGRADTRPISIADSIMISKYLGHCHPECTGDVLDCRMLQALNFLGNRTLGSKKCLRSS